MAKNNLPRLLNEAAIRGYKAGSQVGFQFAADCIMIALHEKEGFGATRIQRIIDELNRLQDYYGAVFEMGMETDVRQEQFDNALRDALRGIERFVPFNERYPGVDAPGYERMPKRK